MRMGRWSPRPDTTTQTTREIVTLTRNDAMIALALSGGIAAYILIISYGLRILLVYHRRQPYRPWLVTRDHFTSIPHQPEPPPIKYARRWPPTFSNN